jgi:putative tricarboxylic transport membrane protein
VKFNDALWGAALLVFAGALFVHAQGFPTIPGQQVGPRALPQLLALGLSVCGVLLCVRGLRAHAALVGARWVELPEWLGHRPQVLGVCVLVAVNLLYLWGVQRLGFIVCGTIYLAALMLVLRVRAARALPVAVVMTLLIHYCFYKLLRVPLPWGWLQPLAW